MTDEATTNEATDCRSGRWTRLLATVVLLVVAVRPASAQGGGFGGGALGDIIVSAIEEAIKVLFSPLEAIVQRHANDVIRLIVGTPHPNRVFTVPTNDPWPTLYQYFWDSIVPLALLLWALSIGLVVFLESTSYLFSSYHRTKLKRRAFSGLLGILAWWWMDALARQLIHQLTLLLAPDLSKIELFRTLSFGSLGALVTAVTLSVDFFLLALVVLIYLIREVMLYLFTLLMPILIAFWIPGVGPLSLVSAFMKRLAGFYVPFLFMTVPVALLFRLAHLLGGNFGLSMQGLGSWLLALVIPIVAIASPFILFWQAGSIFFMAQSASHHSSARRARDRLSTARTTGGSAVHRGRNFVRGARGKAAVKQDGQAVFASGNSRSHAAGSRLNETGSQLRGTLTASATDRSKTSGGTGDSTGSDSDSMGTGDSTDTEANSSTESRNQRFDTLRDRFRSDTQSSNRESSDDDRTADDDPRYLQ